MENWQVALLTVGALLAGLLIPVLWQLRETLKRFAAIGARLEPVIDDAGLTVKRLERISAGFDGREETVAQLADSMGELAVAINRMRDTTRTATAVGAAVAAAVRAFRDVRAGEPAAHDEEASGDETAEEPEESRGATARGNGQARSAEGNEEEATS